jgi:hypothetical protein
LSCIVSVVCVCACVCVVCVCVCAPCRASLLLHTMRERSLLLHTVRERSRLMARVGQNRIKPPCMTVCMVISLPKIPYIHRIWPYIWWFPCQKYRIYTEYDCTFGDFPAKNTVYTPYIPTYKCMVLVKPSYGDWPTALHPPPRNTFQNTHPRHFPLCFYCSWLHLPKHTPTPPPSLFLLLLITPSKTHTHATSLFVSTALI